MYRRIALVAILTAAVTGLGAAQLLPGRAPVAHADGLTSYGSCENLLQHYRTELATDRHVPRLPAGRADRGGGRQRDVVGRGRCGPAVQRRDRRGRQRADRHQPAGAGRRRAGPGQAARRPAGRPGGQPAARRLGRGPAPAARLAARVRQRRLGRRAAAGRRPGPGRRARLARRTGAAGGRPVRRLAPDRAVLPGTPTTEVVLRRPVQRRAAAARGARSTTRSTSAPGWSTARCGWSPRPGRSRRSYYPNAAGRAAEQQARDANLRAAGAVGLDRRAAAGGPQRTPPGRCSSRAPRSPATGRSTPARRRRQHAAGHHHAARRTASPRPTAPRSRPTATSSTPPRTGCTSPPAAGAPSAPLMPMPGQGGSRRPRDRRGEHRAARLRHHLVDTETRYVGSRLRPRVRAGPLGAVQPRGRAARRHDPAAAVGRRADRRDVLDGGQARGAGRRAGRDRPGRRPRPDRAHPRRALLRRHRRGRDVPADRPAVPARPVRHAEGAGRAQGARLLDLPAPRSATGCCSASARTPTRTARSPACRCRCSTSPT